MVSVKKVGEEKGVVKFELTADTALANAIRRVVMQDVACFAVEDVSIYENGSVLFDEFLAHRLGMLPIRSDAKGYKLGDSVKMVLQKEGPCTVYSKDIKSTDPKTEVVDKKIPLTKLTKGQKLKLEMKAVMHSGREHVKWQPAVISYAQDEKDKTVFKFELESSGAFTAQGVLNRAADVLLDKLKGFEKEIKKIK